MMSILIDSLNLEDSSWNLLIQIFLNFSSSSNARYFSTKLRLSVHQIIGSLGSIKTYDI